MRYVLLLWGDEQAELAMSDKDRAAVIDAHRAFAGALRERGLLVETDPLDVSTTAALVRPDGSVTDGPFLETKEQLGGYYVVAVGGRAEAIELAKGVPPSPGLVVEVRLAPAV